MSTPLDVKATPNSLQSIPERLGGVPLPRGLREFADTMSWGTFTATYSPVSGPLRLGHWECVDGDRRATRLGPQPRRYRATFAIGDRIEEATEAACGPVAALIAMLYRVGVPMEMASFHQLACGNHVATFIHGSDGEHFEWGLGWSDDKEESALRAVIACANRIMTLAWYAEVDVAAKKYIWRRRGRRSR